jgi:fumarate reductase subunit D
MPLIVLLVFYALHRVQHAAATAVVPAAATGSEAANTPQ